MSGQEAEETHLMEWSPSEAGREAGLADRMQCLKGAEVLPLWSSG